MTLIKISERGGMEFIKYLINSHFNSAQNILTLYFCYPAAELIKTCDLWH